MIAWVNLQTNCKLLFVQEVQICSNYFCFSKDEIYLG